MVTGSRSPRVLVADFIVEPDREREALPGVEVASLPALLGRAPAEADLLRAVAEAPTPVLIAWTTLLFDRSTLTALRDAGVRALVRSGVGYDNVDLTAARELGVVVCNVPDYGTDEVADHALALLLWRLRELGTAAPPRSVDAANGADRPAARPESWWNPLRFATIPRLQGRTLALLGFGRIGQAVARRAQAFKLDVRWYDPYVPRGQDKTTGTTRVETLQELLTGADALSIHCLLSAETRGLVDAAALALLPPHATLVNTARGPIVDEEALLEALRAGRLAAALDVLTQEPPAGSPLFDAYMRGELPNLLITPHVAWYSQGSAAELRGKAAAEAGRLLRGEEPWNPLTSD